MLAFITSRLDYCNALLRTSKLCHRQTSACAECRCASASLRILVPRGRAPFGQHQESRPLAWSNTGSLRFTDFPSLCACSEPSLTNLIGSGLNLLCFQSHSKTECRWTGPEVAILGADQKERGLWGRECSLRTSVLSHISTVTRSPLATSGIQDKLQDYYTDLQNHPWNCS